MRFAGCRGTGSHGPRPGCFGSMERVRARREAWAQRSLPFEEPARNLNPRAVAHRQQMLAHLASLARQA